MGNKIPQKEQTNETEGKKITFSKKYKEKTYQFVEDVKNGKFTKKETKPLLKYKVRYVVSDDIHEVNEVGEYYLFGITDRW